MKGKGRSRQAILAAVTVLAAAQAGTAYASTGPASESGDDDWMDHSRWTAVLYEHNCRWRGRTDAPRLVEGQCRKMVFLQHCIRWNGRYDRDRMAVD